MSVASLSSPIALVIPSLWVNAGIFLCCSVLFSIVGLWPRKKPLFLVFGALCMTITGLHVSQVVIYSMTTVPDILPALRSRTSLAVLSLPLFYAFVCLYTQYPIKQRWMWPIGLVSLGFLLLNLLSPYTIRYAEITQVMPVRLRWGETVNVEMGRPSAWTHLYLTTWIFAFLWAIRRSLVFYRAGKSADAVFFGSTFLIQLAAILFDVAHSYMQAPHVVLTPYVLTSMAALMGAPLVGSLRKSLDDAEESEHRLRESEQRLSLTLEATSSGMWDWNIQTGDVYFDERWIKSLGYSREEVVPHVSFWEGIVHPEDLPRVRSAWQDHAEGRSPIYECDNRLRTRSGTFRQNLARGKIVEWDADGRPLRMVGTDTDITERKRMEEQLRLTQFAIDHAADAIFIVDTNKRFLYVNNEACRSLEYTRDELMELTVFDIAPIHEPETFRKRFHILKEAGVVRYETIHRTKSGSDIPIDLTINLFELNGTTLMCAVARDITERKQTNEVLQALAVETASVPGGGFFPVLVRQLAAAIGTRYAFVTELVGDEQARVQVLAIWMGDRLGTPFEYNLIHTPCKVVFDQGSAYHPDSVQEIYPNDKDLVALEAMAYLGVTLKDSSSKPIGHLCVLDDKPLLNKHDSLILMNVFAARAAAELERKRAEEALRESEERYRTLMAYAPEAIVVLDVDRGRFVQVNENAVRLFGLPREALLQTGPIELSPPTQPDGRSSSEVAVGLIRAAVNGGTPVFEWAHRTAAGTDITCEVRLVRLPAAGLVLVRGSITDITARKRAEAALRVSEERLRATIDNTPHVAVQWYDKHGRVLYWNHASEMIFGWKSEEALGKTLDQLIQTPEEAAAYVKLLEDIQTTRQSRGPTEYGFHRRDGTSGTCLSTIFAIPSPDGELCFVCMDVDVTERNRVKEQVQDTYRQLRELTGQLEASQEAERKRIARELHDEFGQLITALRVDLFWLSRKSGAQANGASAEEIAQRLKSMTELVDMLARSTRRIAGSLRPSILDDLGLVAALQWQTRDFQERTGLECTLLLGPDVVQMLIQDSQATALFRIAQELLTNIIRHANAQRVQISLQEERGALVMTIDDDGRGITEQDMTKPTSFGLRGIRERVDLIGGELTMKGVPHRGTTVSVRVPMAQQR